MTARKADAAVAEQARAAEERAETEKKRDRGSALGAGAGAGAAAATLPAVPRSLFAGDGSAGSNAAASGGCEEWGSEASTAGAESDVDIVAALCLQPVLPQRWSVTGSEPQIACRVLSQPCLTTQVTQVSQANSARARARCFTEVVVISDEPYAQCRARIARLVQGNDIY
jgi:hypothetical protein